MNNDEILNWKSSHAKFKISSKTLSYFLPLIPVQHISTKFRPNSKFSISNSFALDLFQYTNKDPIIPTKYFLETFINKF